MNSYTNEHRISCHYTSLTTKGYLVYHYCEVLPEHFSLLQKKKKLKTKILYLLSVTPHYPFSQPLVSMNLLSLSGFAYSTRFT